MEDDDERIQVVAGYQMPDVIHHPAHDDDILYRLTHNDPDITGLSVYQGECDAKRLKPLGQAIGKSDYLRTLQIFLHIGRHTESNEYTENEFQSFLVCLARNRSIEHLSLYFERYDYDFAVLAPFIEHNINLRCIQVRGTSGSTSSSLVSTLTQSKMNHLARISFFPCEVWDKTAADLFNFLNVVPGLQNLLDLNMREIGIAREGCLALCALLKNSECRMISLDISDNQLDDDYFDILASGLVECKTLKSLSCGGQQCRQLTTAGWNMFSTYLSNGRCSLEHLQLGGSTVVEGGASYLADSLVVNETLKFLDFKRIRFTPTGWQGISRCLMAPSALMELDLSSSNINDEGAFHVFSALANNTSLKKLLLSGTCITPAGWVACFQLLMNSRSVLRVLNFAYNNIDDEGAVALANLVASHMSTMSSLILWGNRYTTNGVRAFMDVLAPTSTSKLKTLLLGNSSNPINEDIVNDFIAAFARNDSLNELRLDDGDASVESLRALVNILCDATSITNVCNSNHSLNLFIPKDFDVNDDDFDDDGDFDYSYSDDGGIRVGLIVVDILLDMNKNPDKAEVIREKLIRYFFAHVDNIDRAFGSMATSIMPNVVEWIGRDRLGYSVMFELCRSAPTLFNG